MPVIYEDDSLIVVSKPAGMLSVPLERNPGVPSALDHLEQRFRSHGKRRLFVVHRIDQDTSGLIVFAKDARTQRALTDQFKRREPERVYQAIVHGHPYPPQGMWRDRLVWDEKALVQKPSREGDEAISDYLVVESLRGAALIEVRLRTGRRNQIRIQAALRGHALVGERRYVSPDGRPPEIPFERQALHAWRLTFRHPVDGRSIELEAPPPADFVDLLARLRPRSARKQEARRARSIP